MKNVERDKRNVALLEESGWNVVIVWECELKKAVCAQILEQLVNKIRKNCTMNT